MSAEITTRQEKRYRASMDIAGVPEGLHDGLVNYLLHGLPPGSFLTAVLSNDLLGAFKYADPTSRASLFELVSWLYNAGPAVAWGNPQIVNEWLQARAEERTK